MWSSVDVVAIASGGGRAVAVVLQSVPQQDAVVRINQRRVGQGGADGSAGASIWPG